MKLSNLIVLLACAVAFCGALWVLNYPTSPYDMQFSSMRKLHFYYNTAKVGSSDPNSLRYSEQLPDSSFYFEIRDGQVISVKSKAELAGLSAPMP